MKINSIVFKLGATILFLQLIVLIPLGYIILQLILNYSYNETEAQLQLLAQKYAEQIDTLDNRENLLLLEHVNEMTDTRAIIFDQNGQSVMETAGTNQDLIDTLSQQSDTLLEPGHTFVEEYTIEENSYIIVGQPILNGGTSIGSVYLFSSLDQLSSSVKYIITLILLASLGAVLLAIGFTFFLTKRLATPLIEMEKVTKRLAAKKDFNTQINYTADDEIGSLARGINHLSETLLRYQENRSQFFANITHELKTPLTYIKGYAQAIRKKLYQDEKEKETYLEIIENETNQLNNLLDDLTDLSKIEEGKIDLEMKDIDIKLLTEKIINKIQFKAEQKGLSIALKANGSTALLYADENRMEQILTNLIENAIRYTEKGKITVCLKNHLSGLEIFVEDTGIGIKEEDIPFLFERFYRVDKSRSRKSGGTGLGLSIVKELVDMHDGTIEIISTLNEGTQIKLYFPNQMEEN
ncbi:sensor histidine kinase [Saliterribacillus persicus]|uniref:histidine kinase n=1 Tax=Saliterribacillus persicus TaxID=930114 RepID=A0A368XP47_9BACI|nr:ATP-binding protein [Saliterribacillus persicus]RCW69625.1 signal transduction histidine kinase [Saliterribacillus persicus]